RLRLRLRFRLRGRCGACGRVPSRPRRLDVYRGARLRRRGPGLHRKPRCGERLWVETGGNFVAFLRRVLVALDRGQRKPFVGLGVILRHAGAAGVQDAEIVLAVGDAVIGGLAEPVGGVGVIRRPVDALGIEHGEIVHRLAVTLAGRGEIKVARGDEILFHPDAFFVKTAEAELRRRQALLGGAFEPQRRRLVAARHAVAIGEARADLVGGGRIAGERGGAQRRSADAGRQFVAGRRRGARQGAGDVGGGGNGGDRVPRVVTGGGLLCRLGADIGAGFRVRLRHGQRRRRRARNGKRRRRGCGRWLRRRCLRLRFRQRRDGRRCFLGLRRFLRLLGGSSGRRNLRSGFEQPRRDLYAADHDQGGGTGNDQRARALTRILSRGAFA